MTGGASLKKGTYFNLPENPKDIEQLWERASRLLTARLPDWLDPEDASEYRVVGTCPRDGAEADLRELEDAGFIIEGDAEDSGVRQVYMARPHWTEIWSIGIYAGTSPLELSPWPGIANPVLTRDHVTDVPATFVADPFLLHIGGSWYMFFEVMNWRSGKGEIGLATSPDGLTWTYRHIVLTEPFHLSYPYIFEWKDEVFLIPESFQAGAVRLYHARHFPTDWSLAGTLVKDSYLADPSIIRFEGRWWLFVETGGGARHDTLRLFFADELLGPWQEHRSSPIVHGDPLSARPAGRIITAGSRLIRYAQGCLPCYGTDVRAFEVTVLTPTRYEERPASRLPVLGPGTSGWNAGGMHHVDPRRLDDGKWLACVDGWFRCPHMLPAR